MNKGWLELESDPGLFTLLIEDMGVKDVQVEEIYDLQKAIEGTAYGFIFLFRWIEERRSRRKATTEEESFVQDENVVNNIFFAQQVIPNSCATHALLSVLLNCDERVKLGEALSKLKEFSKGMGPEDKGIAIGNMPALASAHNSHARPEPRHPPEKQQGLSTVRTMEAFHYVSYVPINGRLFELDGLKPYPIDHGPWERDEYWTEKFRRVITERLGMATGGEPYHDIRFNLMAVVPDKRSLYEHKLATLKTNRQIVLETLQQVTGNTDDSDMMVKVTNPNLTSADRDKYLAAVKQQGKLTSKNGQEPVQGTSTEARKTETDSNTAPRSSESSEEIICVDDSDSESVKPVTESKVESESKSQVSEETKTCDVQTNVEETQKLGQEHVSECKSVTEDIKMKEQSDEKIDNIKKSPIQKMEEGATSSDLTKPLTIETKFPESSTPSGPSSESTDTASEVGSCFSSPNSGFNSCQNSPQTDNGTDGNSKKEESGQPTRHKRKFSGNQPFTPKDLLALLKNVENEIKLCEVNLKDELEKRRKYQIDDCRRTHNYDQFICTFLSMLAKEGHLADLVEKHSLIKKRHTGLGAGRVSNIKTAAERRRVRTNRRR
uniref:Ubiquitin carboxyl-terminal hydrolase n=1 Tax=Crassostrea virginica TaxID=6565 RepID=A0A8B8BHJ0_CRAVI|nr:ubiquitin carboxyl-terminal hydrolase BAP1-like isoform X2 [Crassostrea virginica]